MESKVPPITQPTTNTSASSNREEPQWLKLSKQIATGSEVDFQVRVHIIEARELQPRDKNGMSDPVCFVRIGDQKKNTITYQKTTSCTWDHLMFFELKMAADEFFHEKITITVFDANTIMRNVEIGSFEFDTTYVYEQKGHEVFRQWIALTYKDPKEIKNKTAGIQGYLKVSVTVLGPKDSAPAHDEAEENDDAAGADLQSLVLLPPSIKTTDYMLEISCYKGEGLPKLDAGPLGKIDGYVAAIFGGNPELKTDVIKNNFSPNWFEKLCLPFQMPTMADQIKLQVRDWDRESKNDDVAGTVFLSLNEVMNGPTDWKSPRWVNLYGIPDGVTTVGLTKEVELANKMNNGAIEGTCFRGRILVGLNAITATDPKIGKFKTNAAPEPPATNYVLRFDLLEAAELQVSGDVTIEVTLGLFSKESKKSKVENGAAMFYQSFEDIAMSLPKDKTQIPDVFINVYKQGLLGKKRIGYIRMKSTELDTKFVPRWQLLTADIFSDVDKSQAAGFIHFNVNLGPAETMGSRTTIAPPKYKKYQLRAHIYQGRDLISSDAEGSSDPYVVVRLAKGSAKTSTKKETVFPIWYESLTIPVELPDPMQFPPDIQVSVYDYDKIDADDFLGRFSVKVTEVNEIMPALPKWYPIYLKDPTIKEGEILASFQLIPEEKAGSIKLAPITPKFRDCTVEINVVSLRELLPFNLLPINKPWIEFDCGDNKLRAKTKTSDKPSGPNPNYLESLQLSVPIPENRIFAPPVNIRVYDDRLIHKPLIATRSISLAPFIPWDNSPIEDTQQHTIKVVTEIPGAKDLKEEEPQQTAPTTITQLDTDEVKVQIENTDEIQLKNLQNVHKDISSIQDTLSTTVKESSLNVPETNLQGAKEEEPRDTRQTVKQELETSLSKPPFGIYKLYRAKFANGRAYKIEAGEFKGQVRVMEKGKEQKAAVDVLSMMKPKNMVARVYILEAFQLVPKDTEGNNPYVRINVAGKNVVKDVDEAKQVTSRPQIFKCYEIPCVFPDETIMSIEIWDFDRFSPHDLIGATRVDLESRYYSDEWKNMKMKPLEYRTLWNPSSSNPQGQIKLYIDILTQEEAMRIPKDPISPPTPINYELRVVVWETKNVILKDNGGKHSDILVVGYPEGQEPQSTDTHWNSKNGEGLFNWRLKFPVTIPNPKPRFKLQVWDRNVMTPNGAICEANLNLKPFYTKTWQSKMDTNSLEKQTMTMSHPSATGSQGEITIQMELLTMDEARKRPAGFGREEPNDNPKLDPPNRPADSLAPWDVGNKLKLGIGNLWKAHKWKLYGCIACFIILLILILALYIYI